MAEPQVMESTGRKMPDGPAILWALGTGGTTIADHFDTFLEAVEMGVESACTPRLIECDGKTYSWRHPAVQAVVRDVEQEVAAWRSERPKGTLRSWSIEVRGPESPRAGWYPLDVLYSEDLVQEIRDEAVHATGDPDRVRVRVVEREA